MISPDPLLSINEVGVPSEVARGLTVPLEVTLHNQEVAKSRQARAQPAPGRGPPTTAAGSTTSSARTASGSK